MGLAERLEQESKAAAPAARQPLLVDVILERLPAKGRRTLLEGLRKPTTVLSNGAIARALTEEGHPCGTEAVRKWRARDAAARAAT